MFQKIIFHFQNFFLISLFLYKIKLSYEDSNPYRVYETNNNYPRPLLLESGDVMAFSGNPARMSRYSKNGDLIYENKNMGEVYKNFVYDQNAAFIQYTNSNDGNERFIMAEGQGNLKLYLIDDNGIITKKEFVQEGINVVSYKIDIYKLNDNSILVSYVHGYKNDDKCFGQKVHFRTIIYNEESKNFEFGDFHIEENTDNCYVSCTQTISLTITCMYVKQTCNEYSLTFNINDPSNKKLHDIDSTVETGCGFDKVIHLDDDYVVYTYLNNNRIKYKISQVLNDNTLKFITENTGHPSLTNCVIDTMKVDVTKIGSNKFAISCVGTDNKGHIELVDFDGENYSSTTKSTITSNIDYPFVSKFGDEYLSLFYSVKVTDEIFNNVFEIIGYPSCEDYQVSDNIYTNANTETFSLENYVKRGSGEDSNAPLEIYFSTVPSQTSDGTLYWISGSISNDVSAGSYYPNNTFFMFQSGYQTGTIKINYAAKRNDKIGPLCWMIFNVNNCYLGCKSCPSMGNQIDNKCYGCNDIDDYTSEYEEKDYGRTQTINCHKLDEPFEGHYLEDGYFKKCWNTCKFCIAQGSNIHHQCSECLTTDVDNNIIATYPVIDDDYEINNFSCYREGDSPSGFYFDGTAHIKCYITCETCVKGEEYEEKREDEEIINVIKTQNCDSCKSEYVKYGNECLNQCPEKLVNVNQICTNCKEISKYNYQNQCVDSQPVGTDMVDEDYNYVESCGEKCATCKIVDTNINCLSCKLPYYKKYNSEDINTHYVECEINCDKYLVKDDIKRECINCKENINNNKYYYNGECVDINDGNHDNYYESEEIEEKQYGVIEKCNINCATCFGKEYTIIDSSTNIESEIENCKSCDGILYLLEKNCVQNCPPYLVPDNTDHKCINCKDRNLWNYNQNCVPQNDIPVPYVIIDDAYNLVSNCDPPCLTCKISDSNKIECTSCVSPYFFKRDNSEEEKCVLNCGAYLVEDTDLNECINCKVNSQNPNKKYYYNGMCVDLEDPDYINYYESEDEDKNPYGVIEKCYELCRTCIGKEIIFPNSIEMKCTSCINGYYLELSPSTNCVIDCGRNLGIDDSNSVNWKCVNCKETLTDYGTEQYKVIYRNSEEQDNHCVNIIYPGYYLSDNEYNVIEPCDDSCLTCEGSSDYCIECAEGYISNPYKIHQCVKECKTKYWYVDDNNDYKCSDECFYITDSKREKIGGNQCVEKCTSDLCIFCQKNDAFYVLNNICVFKCPNGYSVDSDNVCINNDDSDSECKTRIDNARHSVYLANLADSSDEWIGRYLYSYGTKSEKNVDIYKTHNTTFQIFKDDNCQFESSVRNGISYINTTDCKNTLMKEHGLKSNEILFVKYDINRTLMVNQVHYNVYNAITKEILDISICGEEQILYPFDSNSQSAKIAKYYKDLIGIDVFDINDPFFNDICFQFYDIYKNDVILAHRRYFIFQNISLCEKGCNYKGFDINNYMINCVCPNQLPSLSEVTKLTETQGAEDWKRRLKEGNIECIKCYNLVFSKKYIKKNAGFFILFFILLLQIPSLITLLFNSAFTHIYAFVNQFTYINNQISGENLTPNPPKKNEYQNEINIENISSTIKNDDSEFDSSNSSERNKSKSDINSSSNNNNYSNSSEISNSKEEESKEKSIETESIYSNKNQKKISFKRNSNFTDLPSNSNSFRESPITIIRNTPKNCSSKKKLQILTNKSIKLVKNEKLVEGQSSTNYNINTISTEFIKKKNYTKPNDEEVESFDEDEIDYLQISDAIDYDMRSFIYYFWRVSKKKVIFLKPFTDISVFEPFSIKICNFLFIISWFFTFSCLLFRDKYIGERYLTQKSLKVNYTISHDIKRSFYVGLICSFISICFDYLLVVKKKFVLVIRYERDQNQFLKKTKEIIKSYKYRLIFFLTLDFILIIFFWYYVSSFCAVYVGTQSAMIISSLFALLFGSILQFVFAFIITCFRKIGLECNNNICYKISQILL